MTVETIVRSTDISTNHSKSQQQQIPPPPLNNVVPFYIYSIIPPLYICYRIYMVLYIPIMDCDEIYNYWEPLHYLLYRTGFQTWEYHYRYALRTYTYLLPLQLVAQLYTFLMTTITGSDDKTILFLTLRQSIATATACCELFFLYALLQYYRDNTIHRYNYPKSNNDNNSNPKGNNNSNYTDSDTTTDTYSLVPYVTAILLLTCTGMNHSASALLPSATYISIWCTCTGCFLLQYHTIFIIFAIIGTLTTGWPFGCICILPMAIHIVYKECLVYQRPLTLITTIIVTSMVVQGIVTWIDTMHYGSITFPTFNIFIYNAGQSNDTLYGVEPLSYYIKNLFLNCNFMSILGCIAIPVYLVFPTTTTPTVVASSNAVTSQQQHQHSPTKRYDANVLSILLSLPIWFMITLPRPHKEERFMYPIYPVLIYGSVLTIDILLSFILKTMLRNQKSSSFVAKNNHFMRWKSIGHVCVWIPIILLSFSRTFALYKYYHAPIDVYNHLSTFVTKATSSKVEKEQYSTLQNTNQDVVCTCGEWYRYMSSFYLPEGDVKIQIPIGFLPSSFKGQLPQPFTQYGSKYESLKYVQPFNDQNEEVIDRYVKNVQQCKYLIDVSDSNDCRTQFNAQQTNVIPIYAVPFLDTDRTTVLHRILYIPYLHEREYRGGSVTYKNYTLYRIETKKDNDK